MVPTSRLPVLAGPSGCRPKEGTCNESDNANVTNDDYPTTNGNETDSNDHDDDILKEINEKFSSSEDAAPLFMPPKFPDSLWSSIKESTRDFYKQRSLYGIHAKVFSSIKPFISILKSYKDDETKTQITSVI